MPSEEIADTSLGAVAGHGPAEPARRDESETRRCAIIRENQEGDETAGDTMAASLHAREVRARAQAIPRGEGLGAMGHDPRGPRLSGWTSTQSGACVPSHGGA